MLLTITYTGDKTQNIGFLFHKNPARPQVFPLNQGKAYVFYPQVSDQQTTIALLLDIDPLDLARGKADAPGTGLFDYVNDRPYVSSSFMSVAIAHVFGSAMNDNPVAQESLAASSLDLTARLTMLPCRSELTMLNAVFEPLGYTVSYETYQADEQFPQWNKRQYINLTLRGKVRPGDLLRHLYVLIPVFDRNKHYWVGKEEVDKLLRLAEDWLRDHPAKAFITRRYLSKSRALANLALARLRVIDNEEDEDAPAATEDMVENEEKRLSLNRQRLGSVVSAVKDCGARKVLDLGCGEGHLLSLLMNERGIDRIVGMDVSCSVLQRARERLNCDRWSEAQQRRITLMQGSLTYRDERLRGFDCACVVEVIEHMDLPRLGAFERVLFEDAHPAHIILTTPNREYNDHYELTGMRHSDHRFEWDRAEFRDWATRVADRYGYSVRYSGIGDADEQLGTPTQMAIFTAIQKGEE